jgi:hypothetical protein
MDTKDKSIISGDVIENIVEGNQDNSNCSVTVTINPIFEEHNADVIENELIKFNKILDTIVPVTNDNDDDDSTDISTDDDDDKESTDDNKVIYISDSDSNGSEGTTRGYLGDSSDYDVNDDDDSDLETIIDESKVENQCNCLH